MVTVDGQRRRRAALLDLSFQGFVAVFVITFVGVLIIQPGGQDGERWFSDLVLTGITLGGGAGGLLMASRMRGRNRFSWMLIAAATLAWGLGQTVWSYYELIAQTDTPFPSFADLGYLAMIPLMFAGLVSLPSGVSRSTGRIKIGLDAVIVMTGIATVCWYVLLGPLYSQNDASALKKLIGSAYPAGDVLLLFALVGGMARGWLARRDGSMFLLLLGIGAFIVADLGFNYLTLHNDYQSGNPIDLGWPLGFILVTYAIGRTWVNAVTPTQPSETTSAQARTWLSRLGRAAPYLLVLGVSALLFFSRLQQRTVSSNIFTALSLLTVLLVLVRQYFTLRENAELNNRLIVFSRELETRIASRTSELATANESLKLEINERARIADALLRTEEHLRAILANAPLMIFGLDDQATITVFEGKATESLVSLPTAIVGRPVFDVFAHVPAMHEHVRHALAGDDFDTRIDVDGLTFDVRFEPMRDETGIVVGAIVAGFDITARQHAERQLVHQAFHDALTGLPNRSLFMERLKHALVRSGRRQDGVSVLFLDLDRFKVINDSLGHGIGDSLLVAAGERLIGLLREEDTVARLGGDEFTVLLEEVNRAADAVAVAEQIVMAFQRPFVIDSHELFVTVSIGVAVSRSHVVDPSEVLRTADVALYQAKAAGRSCAMLFDAVMDANAVEQLALENDLRRALERDELVLHYQPDVELASGEVVGVEALVRWQHPQRGLIAPNDFIPLAEETGLIVPIGRWVLEEACRQTVEWRARRNGERELIVSVNLSPRQFHEDDLVDQVAAVLRITGLPPACLRLEITEGMVMRHVEKTIETLHALKALGVLLAIDDFGTGYSSLSYLARFPVDTLKVDQAFVRALGAESGTAAIVEATVALAHALGMDVTAEGIEAVGQLKRLQALHCDRGQGFYFSRPLPPEAVSPMIDALLSTGHQRSA